MRHRAKLRLEHSVVAGASAGRCSAARRADAVDGLRRLRRVDRALRRQIDARTRSADIQVLAHLEADAVEPK